MFGDMPHSLYGSDSGQSAVRNMLLLSPMVQLGGMPNNFTLAGARSECQGGGFEALLLWLGVGWEPGWMRDGRLLA